MIRNLLAGLAGASADVFAQQAARKAQEKKLQVDAIQKQIDSGDLTPEDTLTQMGTMYDLLGVPKDAKSRLLNASNAAHQAYLQHPNRQAFEDAQNGMAQGPAPLTDQTSGQAPAPQGIGDVPTQERTGQQNSQMAPPIPQFQSQTMNQLALPEQIKQKYALVAAAAKADTDGKLGLLKATEDYKAQQADEIDAKVKSGEYTPEQAARRYEIIDVKPLKAAGSGGAATYLPQPMSGTELRAKMQAQGMPQAKIDDIEDGPALYKVTMDPTKTKVIDGYKIVGNTFQGKGVDGGTIDPTKFPNGDYQGHAFASGQMYYPVLNRAGGTVQSWMPETLVNTTAVVNKLTPVTQANGDTVFVPNQSVTQTSKTPAGASATPATPPPALPPALGGPIAITPTTPATPGVLPPGSAPKPKRGANAAPTPTPNTPPPVPTAKINGPGVVAGGRPMTPEQKQKTEQQTEQLNNSIGVIKDLKSQLPVLNSMISAGKIAWQTDPLQNGAFHAIINYNMPMTEAEKNVAANWQLLSEGVMQMRIPMGGSGFRGPEGWGATQSNRGILGQNPDIIKRVLDGTLREFKAQRDPMVKNASKYGYNVNPEMEHGPAPTYTYAVNKANGHRIKSLDGKNWVDADTGVPIQ